MKVYLAISFKGGIEIDDKVTKLVKRYKIKPLPNTSVQLGQRDREFMIEAKDFSENLFNEYRKFVKELKKIVELDRVFCSIDVE